MTVPVTVSTGDCVDRSVCGEGSLYLLESKNGTYIGDLRINDIYITDHTTFRCAGIVIDFDIIGKDMDAVEVDISRENHFGKLLGDSIAMREIFGLLSRVSHTDATVLIQGEPGSGKELVANAIWSNSKRADKPYVIFDCSTVSRDLVESELFGIAGRRRRDLARLLLSVDESPARLGPAVFADGKTVDFARHALRLGSGIRVAI